MTKNWRLTPGYLGQGYSDFESVHILLGRFIDDCDLIRTNIDNGQNVLKCND
jgi:hypothetical protein